MNVIQQLSDQLEKSALWEGSRQLERNEYLTVKGSLNDRFYLVVSGSLRIFIREDEEEHTIRFGYSGNLIAALDTFITGKPTELYIQALKHTELKYISRKSLKAFLESNAERLVLWQEIMLNMIHQQMEREHDILISSPTRRYLRVLDRSPQLFQEIPHKYIASYLRMTPETLSRIKKS